MQLSIFNMTYKEMKNTDIIKYNLFFDDLAGSLGSHSTQTSLGASINTEIHPYGQDDRDSEDFNH